MSIKSIATGGVSSPAATGGAGTGFEQNVNTYWLTQLLVCGIPPVLHDCNVVEVHFQTEHLGWNTDDFLIVGEDGSGNQRKLAGQVKRAFSVSVTDEECKKAMQDFWKDFKNVTQFSHSADRFALVTLRGTNTLLEHFSGLLDCARASKDAADFEHRLTKPGFISRKAIKYCDDIRSIVSDLERRDVAVSEIWPFLRVFHVLSLDLNTSTRQTETAMKTLLAHTAGDQNPLAAAETTWNALLREVIDGMPHACSLRYEDLPEAVRKRHSKVASLEQRALRAMSDHSAPIVNGIRSTIGANLHLGRDSLVQKVIEALESAQIVLISGSAGCGKSGVAKAALGILGADHFAFAFRAEEFATPHFDDTLNRSQIPANASTLNAVLAAQARKVLLIESVERLLEASTRDAFTDLLMLVCNDRSWQVILTCRDYSADLVRNCFLSGTGVAHTAVAVPPLNDEELKEVEDVYSSLSRPLANPALRNLFRNPYILDKALLIPWSDDRPLPQSEREFRALVWQMIIRADHQAGGGMPRKREQVFVQVALRRARALTLYAACGDLDAGVIDALRRDSLVVASTNNNVLVAPAHDVLEDWAILNWIDDIYATNTGSVSDLCSSLGTHPAVRRTFRKWVSELVEKDAVSADALFREVVSGEQLSAQFRDDTIVSLLRSIASSAFLERHVTVLFANDMRILKRVIHLLRVACVTPPVWLKPAVTGGSLFNVPDGPAWACVFRLVESNLPSIRSSDCPLLLGLLQDWARGINYWQCPYPEGSESAVSIAYWLLPHFDDYRSDDQRKRLLKVIAMIPNADRDRFIALLHGRQDGEKRVRATEGFVRMIFNGMEGWAAARDLPDVVASTATKYLLCTESDLQRDWAFGSDMELELLFGIKMGRSHDFFPASAYRSPLLAILRKHPMKGVSFVIAIFNHSADWYAKPRVPSMYVEEPFEIELTFSGGTTKKQWCNDRLWKLYRGFSVGPYVLQSLLMALEKWLLEFAVSNVALLDKTLLHLLKKSDSAAITAVVASVATAHPHASVETLLVLLQNPMCILLDRGRMTHETISLSKMGGPISGFEAENRVFADERKEADNLPHRSLDLELAVTSLQCGPLAKRVQEILDKHRDALPPISEQEEFDRYWRLSLHRMDLRQYTAKVAPEIVGPEDKSGPERENQLVVCFEPSAPDADLQEIVDVNANQAQAMNVRVSLLMWGMKVFQWEDRTIYDPTQWKHRLSEAREIENKSTGEGEPGDGGPGYVAAVCIRDHWDEMSDDERKWSVEKACFEVGRDAGKWNHFQRVQRYEMSGDRPCARVLPLLLGETLADDQVAKVRQAFSQSLTHSIDEVRSYAAKGIGTSLWEIDRDLAVRCTNAIAMEAELVEMAVDAERERLKRAKEFSVLYSNEWVDPIEGKVAQEVRQRLFEPNGVPTDAMVRLDSAEWFAAKANGRILTILSYAPAEPVSIDAFNKVTQTLVAWWDAADDRHRHRTERRPERNFDTEYQLTQLLVSFLLRTSLAGATSILTPILDAVDRHPREVKSILHGLIIGEDRSPNTPQFWSLWGLFAARVRAAKWLAEIDEEHPCGGAMMSTTFLGISWKPNAQHWPSLEGNASHVDSLFDALPASSTVLDCYVQMLYHIGEQSLPDAFIRIANRIQQGNPTQMLKKSNTVYLIEVLLQRYVYAKPLALKSSKELRDAVLLLLDLLVENGSSAAFRMRDDFVTPVSISV
jgi:hypothetical protein